MATFITGMLSGVFKDKTYYGKDYLVQLENKSLDEVEDKIESYRNEILAASNTKENESTDIGDINYAKYYENTVFIG